MKSCDKTLCMYNKNYTCIYSSKVRNYNLCPIIIGKWDKMIDEVVKKRYGKEN